MIDLDPPNKLMSVNLAYLSSMNLRGNRPTTAVTLKTAVIIRWIKTVMLSFHVSLSPRLYEPQFYLPATIGNIFWLLRWTLSFVLFCQWGLQIMFWICCISPLAWSEQVLCRANASAARLSVPIPEQRQNRSCQKSVLRPRELPGEPWWGKKKKDNWAKRRLVFKMSLFISLPFFFFSIHWTGEDIESYLSTLMETMLSTLNNNENLKIKELTVSAIGGIGEKLSVSGLRTGMNDWMNVQTCFDAIDWALIPWIWRSTFR